MTPVAELRALSRAGFSLAQVCLATTLTADGTALVVGTYGLIHPSSGGWVAFALACIALVSASARVAGDRLTWQSNAVLRRLDLHDGVGRPIDALEAADFLDSASWVTRRWAQSVEIEPYFGSAALPSPQRLVQNLRESAWWTKRLAQDMARAGVFLTVGLVAAGALTLMAAINGLLSPAAADSAAPWLSAGILFVISQSPYQASRRYASLRDGAEKAQERAAALLGARSVREADAIDLAAEYHLVRQCAPVIPTLWYNRRRSGLNRLWRSTVQVERVPSADRPS